MSWYQISSFNKKDLSDQDLMKILDGLPNDLGKLAEEIGLSETPNKDSEEFETWRDRAMDFVNMISETETKTANDHETPEYWGVKQDLLE